MHIRLSRLALPLACLLLSTPTLADICDDLAQQAHRWDLIGYTLDELIQNNMTLQDAARMNEAIGIESADSRAIADQMIAAGGYLETTYGQPLNQGLLNLSLAEDWDDTFAALAMIHTLMDAAASECQGDDSAAESRPPGGRFIIQYAPPPADQMSEDQVQYFQNLIETLQRSGGFEETATMVSETLHLPTDIPITFDFCGVANAFYDPNQTAITLCYEYFTMIIDTFISNEITGSALDSTVNGVGNYVLLHEIGHALVHLLDIPITGREEDSADNLASLILIQSGSVDALSAAMVNYAIMASLTAEASAGQYPFHDEHSLDAQRMYDMMCMIYGSDPDSYADIVGEDGLPKERADRCPYEYVQKDRAWDTLLGPHFIYE